VVAGAGRRLPEPCQLVGEHAAAVGMPDRHLSGGRARRVGRRCWWFQQGPEGGGDLGQQCLVQVTQPAVGATGGVPAGWGEHAAAAAAPVHVGQAAGWAVAQPGRAEPVVPATAPRGHQRTGEPQGRRFLQLAEGGQASGAVDIEGVEADAGGQAEVGLGPAAPPAADLVGVGGGLLDAGAEEGMLGRPVTGRPAATRAGQAGLARDAAGQCAG
jgi:hypothetical protein